MKKEEFEKKLDVYEDIKRLKNKLKELENSQSEAQ